MNNLLENNNLQILCNIIINQKTPHAMLFEVDDSDSCMPLIKSIIKLILCKKEEKSLSNINCDNCNICNLIDTDNYPDIKIISNDGSWIKKQQLIDLKKDFNNKSLLNNKKIYIIKDADKLNAASSNSLLKFLEEPEEDIIAILLTTNKYLLLDTILSRCQVFNLKELNYKLDSKYIDKVKLFIEYLVKKKNFFINYKELVDNVFVDKNNTKILLNEVEKYFLNYLIKDINIDLNESNLYNNFNDEMLIDQMVYYVNIIEKEKQKLEYNVNFKLWIDAFFANLMGEVYDRSCCSYS